MTSRLGAGKSITIFYSEVKYTYVQVLGAAPCVPDEVDSCVWAEVWAGEE